VEEDGDLLVDGVVPEQQLALIGQVRSSMTSSYGTPLSVSATSARCTNGLPNALISFTAISLSLLLVDRSLKFGDRSLQIRARYL
jgi:hypothetical protein